MKSILQSIIHVGVSGQLSKTESRSIVLCNSLSLAFGFLPIVFVTLVWIVSGTSRFNWPLLIQPFLTLIPIGINFLGFTKVSRLALSWVIPTIVLVYSVYNKIAGIDIESSSYVGFRYTMIASTIVPFIVFQTQQKIWIFLALLVPMVSILAYDPIHAYFGVGYYDVGLTDTSYSINNIRALMAILMIGSVSIILKRLQEISEEENSKLVNQLSYAHKELHNQLHEIKSRNEEINKQNEQIQSQNSLLESQYQELLKSQIRLIENKKELEKANRIIENQKQVLTSENQQLEVELLARNNELERTVQDLIQYNNNLTQYSFMVSHNLRGPVASIQGLLSLTPKEKLDGELYEIYDKLEISVKLLDSVIKDMNTIIDSQRNLSNVKEKIYWSDSVNKNLQFFSREIQEHEIEIKTNFDHAPFIVSIRTTIDSIVYNLISNAIKFRSPYRKLIIKIDTYLENDTVIFRITDNGLGLDMSSQKESIFKMYKRLHSHVEGKGLGLYMVKLQAELLNGRIDVDSKQNEFTTFTLRLPATQIGEQVLFEKEYGRITYNALSNSTQIHFKKEFTSEEYREIYQAGLDCYRRFKVAYVLADLRNSNSPEIKDQEWLFNYIVPEAAKSGLKRVALVSNADSSAVDMEAYLAGVNHAVKTFGIELRYFQNLPDANEWLTRQ